MLKKNDYTVLSTLKPVWFLSLSLLRRYAEEETDEMKSQSRVLKLLPLFIGYISLTVPAGLTLYW